MADLRIRKSAASSIQRVQTQLTANPYEENSVTMIETVIENVNRHDKRFTTENEKCIAASQTMDELAQHENSGTEVESQYINIIGILRTRTRLLEKYESQQFEIKKAIEVAKIVQTKLKFRQ